MFVESCSTGRKGIVDRGSVKGLIIRITAANATRLYQGPSQRMGDSQGNVEGAGDFIIEFDLVHMIKQEAKGGVRMDQLKALVADGPVHTLGEERYAQLRQPRNQEPGEMQG